MSRTPTLFPVKHRASETATIEAQIADAGLPEPTEVEYRFAAAVGRQWKFDLAWPEYRIAFEQEGATFGRVVIVQVGVERRRGQSIPLKAGTVLRLGGRHNEGTGFDGDCVKYGTAAAMGWCVIRASTRMIRDGEAIELLRMAFRMRASTRRTPEEARTATI